MLIGIIGKMHHGKTTFAEYLAESLREASSAKVCVVGFADELKEMAISSGFCTAKEAYETKPPEVRKVLQNIGKMFRGCVAEDFWIRRLAEKIKKMPKSDYCVVHDVRMLNEANWIDANDGLLIRVKRAGMEDADTDVSETQQDGIEADITVENDDDLVALKEAADDLAAFIIYSTGGADGNGADRLRRSW